LFTPHGTHASGVLYYAARNFKKTLLSARYRARYDEHAGGVRT